MIRSLKEADGQKDRAGKRGTKHGHPSFALRAARDVLSSCAIVGVIFTKAFSDASCGSLPKAGGFIRGI